MSDKRIHDRDIDWLKSCDGTYEGCGLWLINHF